MAFKAVRLSHREHINWDRITHLKVRDGAQGDSEAGRRILEHIRVFVDASGVASINRIAPGFPARTQRGMRYDLRAIANERDSGENDQDKGLIELGWIE
jgi:hypothetical protein